MIRRICLTTNSQRYFKPENKLLHCQSLNRHTRTTRADGGHAETFSSFDTRDEA